MVCTGTPEKKEKEIEKHEEGKERKDTENNGKKIKKNEANMR